MPKPVARLVYTIQGMNCERSYVGNTKQHLKNRVRQHKYDCDQKQKGKKHKTALAMHHFEEQHYFDFNNVKIIEMEQNDFKRTIT